MGLSLSTNIEDLEEWEEDPTNSVTFDDVTGNQNEAIITKDGKTLPRFFVDDVVCIRDTPKKLGWVARTYLDSGDDDEEDDYYAGEEEEEGDGEDYAGEGGRKQEEQEGKQKEESDGTTGKKGKNSTDEEKEERPELSIEEVEIEWQEGTRSVHRIGEIGLIDRLFWPGDIVGRINDPKGQIGVVQDINLFVDLRFIDGQRIRNVNTRMLKRIHAYEFNRFVVRNDWVGQVDELICEVTVGFPDGSVCRFRPSTDECFDSDGMDSWYYPGQRVTCAPEILKSGRWLHKQFSGQVTGHILGLSPLEAVIEWVASREFNAKPPKQRTPLQGLQTLACFLHCNWEITDCAMVDPELRVENGAVPVDERQRADIRNIQIGKLRPAKEEARFIPKGCPADLCGIVESMYTYCDVLWQDGTTTKDVRATGLFAVNTIVENDFCPNALIQSKSVQAQGSSSGSVSGRNGIVKSVNSTERTGVVKWLNDNFEVVGEEEQSLYDLVAHPDFEFYPGEVVMRYHEDEGKKKKSKKQKKAENKLPWIGEVIGFEGGKIRVGWSNGSSSCERPDKLFQVRDEDDSDEESGEESEEEETEEDENEIEEEEEEEEEEEKTEEESKVGEGNKSEARVTEDEKEEKATAAVPATATVSVKEEALNTSSETATNILGIEDEENFPSFAVVTDATQHHFLTHVQVRQERIQARFVRRVMSEWDILQNNLPEGIWVRVYELHMDLMKMVIVGSHSTPYYLSLFVFDVQIPSDYPLRPPNFHYANALSQKFHPNLNENGRVCLSLLGTWTGKGVEVWSSTTSNILRVAVSIQGLILGADEPYYLEAGYDKQKGSAAAERASELYNENALLMSLQSMMAILKNPPQHFEALVFSHFTKRGNFILQSLDKFFSTSDFASLPFGVSSPSQGFLRALSNLLPKLRVSFASLGLVTTPSSASASSTSSPSRTADID